MDKLKRRVPENEDHQTTTESWSCCYRHPKEQNQIAMIPNNTPLTLSNATYCIYIMGAITMHTFSNCFDLSLLCPNVKVKVVWILFIQLLNHIYSAIQIFVQLFLLGYCLLICQLTNQIIE